MQGDLPGGQLRTLPLESLRGDMWLAASGAVPQDRGSFPTDDRVPQHMRAKRRRTFVPELFHAYIDQREPYEKSEASKRSIARRFAGSALAVRCSMRLHQRRSANRVSEEAN